MRAVARLAFPALIALLLTACGEQPPAAGTPPSTPPSAPPSATPEAAAGIQTVLDTDALRERASASLAANRLYTPTGNNAVEDYLTLRERLPGDASVETALVDLAPYVMIGAEQATAAGDFDEASRLIALLARIDEAAPSVPRLREALVDARTAAEEQREAEAAEAETARIETARIEAARVASEQARRQTAATQPPAAEAARPNPAAARPVPPPVAPIPTAPAPTRAANPTTAVERAVVSQVQPRFPEAAMRRRLEGTVELRVRISADGRVENVTVVNADPPNVFDREAVLAVRRWRYAPADAPSETRVVLRFRRP